VRSNVHPILQSLAQGFNLTFRQGRGRTIEADELDYPRQLQHPKSLGEQDVHKNIAGKQHQLDFLAPVLPASNRAIEREKALDSSFLELLCYPLFVPRTGIGGIPARVRLDYAEPGGFGWQDTPIQD
jgi:hypothetical protein